MKARSLWQLRVTTSAEAEEALMELLIHRLPAPGSSYHHLETGQVWLTWFLQSRPKSVDRIKKLIRTELGRVRGFGLDPGPGRITVSRLGPQDWAESWKRHFKPLRIGGVLLIRPSWSRARARRDQQEITLDPGLSFGTGQHPTTAFCLEQIARYRPETEGGRSMLDIGTGSGILAIAGAKLGYRPVGAFDFDPAAVKVAKENARINRVSRLVKIRRDDICRLRSPLERHDLVCANLIANLLLEQQKRILATVSPGGVLVLAGILKSEFPAVRRAYEDAGFKLMTSKAVKEWRSGAFRRLTAR
jgi:ribosomal protein L11 methyltransferase